MRKSSGYILILTLLLLSTSFILISSILQKTFAYLSQSNVELEIEQARQMALSGVQIVLSKVSLVIPKKNDKDKGNKADAETNKNTSEANSEKKQTPEQKWLLELLPIMNSWQTINLNYDSAYVDAKISYYISSQQGKFNLNKIDKDLNELIKKTTKVDILSVLADSKKQLGRQVQDVTELTNLPGFESLKNKNFVSVSDSKDVFEIVSTDLFSVENKRELELINPWLISRSTGKVLGLEVNKDIKDFKDIVSKLRPSMNWQTEWDQTLAKIYSKKFDSIDPKIKKLFTNKFTAESFFIVCHATINSVTQKVAALIRLEKPSQEFAPESKIYKIAQLYWI